MKNKTNTLTPDEMAIFQRVKSEQDDWKTITEESVSDYSLMQDPFKLPAEVKAFEIQKMYKFRWIERKSSRLDEVRSANVPHKWWIVNADTIPELAELCDPILGSINRLDQMLVFKPWWMWEKRQQIFSDITDAQDRSGALERQGIDSRDGVQMIPGKRTPDQTMPLRGEVRGGDKIEYEEPGSHDSSLDDLVDE